MDLHAMMMMIMMTESSLRLGPALEATVQHFLGNFRAATTPLSWFAEDQMDSLFMVEEYIFIFYYDEEKYFHHIIQYLLLFLLGGLMNL